MAKVQRIDFVIPFYNPSLGWELTLLERLKALQSARPDLEFHFILVDDGSDRTIQLDQTLSMLGSTHEHIEVLRIEQNQGKGNALRVGFQSSLADRSIFTDVDMPYEIQSMIHVIEALENGADVALGYREHDYYVSVPWFRKGLSEGFRFVLKDILKFPITDTQCGLKGMNAKGKSIFLQTKVNRFLVDMEFIKLSVRQKGIRVQPVVVHLRGGVTFSKMGATVLLQEVGNFIKLLFR